MSLFSQRLQSAYGFTFLDDDDDDNHTEIASYLPKYQVENALVSSLFFLISYPNVWMAFLRIHYRCANIIRFSFTNFL